jgi:hypothetical protein
MNNIQRIFRYPMKRAETSRLNRKHYILILTDFVVGVICRVSSNKNRGKPRNRLCK